MSTKKKFGILRPKPPTADPYDTICPYFAHPSKNIQFSYEPIRFARPRLSKTMYKNSTGQTKQLRAPSDNEPRS